MVCFCCWWRDGMFGREIEWLCDVGMMLGSGLEEDGC